MQLKVREFLYRTRLYYISPRRGEVAVRKQRAP